MASPSHILMLHPEESELFGFALNFPGEQAWRSSLGLRGAAPQQGRVWGLERLSASGWLSTLLRKCRARQTHNRRHSRRTRIRTADSSHACTRNPGGAC
jgi:hypothetical protein